jgi:hypothetical protein
MGTIKIYFKWCHKQYYQQYCEGNLLLWARDTKTGEDHFLGIFKDNTIKLSEAIYNKAWDIQHGASKLAALVYKCYHEKGKDMKKEEKIKLPSRYFVIGRS